MMKALLQIEAAFKSLPVKAGSHYEFFPGNQIAFSLLEQDTDHGLLAENEEQSELQRLEHKLNLVISLLGQMMAVQQERPAKTCLKLGADFISWYEPGISIDSEYLIELFLSEDMALPIKARVVVDEVDDNWCLARFTNLSSDQQSAWERWVFRQHRRQVALQRGEH